MTLKSDPYKLLVLMRELEENKI